MELRGQCEPLPLEDDWGRLSVLSVRESVRPATIGREGGIGDRSAKTGDIGVGGIYILMPSQEADRTVESARNT